MLSKDNLIEYFHGEELKEYPLYLEVRPLSFQYENSDILDIRPLTPSISKYVARGFLAPRRNLKDWASELDVDEYELFPEDLYEEAIENVRREIYWFKRKFTLVKVEGYSLLAEYLTSNNFSELVKYNEKEALKLLERVHELLEECVEAVCEIEEVDGVMVLENFVGYKALRYRSTFISRYFIPRLTKLAIVVKKADKIPFFHSPGNVLLLSDLTRLMMLYRGIHPLTLRQVSSFKEYISYAEVLSRVADKIPSAVLMTGLFPDILRLKIKRDDFRDLVKRWIKEMKDFRIVLSTTRELTKEFFENRVVAVKMDIIKRLKRLKSLE
ncbi:MAG: hypothetical protein DRJ52_02355 [Thermoprotei archaeon]|nr:MAG: hypothetical protein DRJ52_02355 [Thermoprotei archaeon]RLE99988.1 MAG: hypothetical protein DRJ63_03715 [Thermoprotei archaeon]HDI74970.1 hypothetical protein [Thermoprotei archaeon]